MGPRFRMGRRGVLVGAAVGARVANSSAKSQQADAATDQTQQQYQQPAPQPMSTNDQFSELEKLGQLKDQGILTQGEFDA